MLRFTMKVVLVTMVLLHVCLTDVKYTFVGQQQKKNIRGKYDIMSLIFTKELNRLIYMNEEMYICIYIYVTC